MTSSRKCAGRLFQTRCLTTGKLNLSPNMLYVCGQIWYGIRNAQCIGARARGLGGCSPQTRTKPLFFGQKLTFAGRSQQPKMKKVFFFVFIKQKTEFILSSEIKCPKPGIFANNYPVG